jgi:hypothetical protein
MNSRALICKKNFRIKLRQMNNSKQKKFIKWDFRFWEDLIIFIQEISTMETLDLNILALIKRLEHSRFLIDSLMLLLSKKYSNKILLIKRIYICVHNFGRNYKEKTNQLHIQYLKMIYIPLG